MPVSDHRLVRTKDRTAATGSQGTRGAGSEHGSVAERVQGPGEQRVRPRLRDAARQHVRRYGDLRPDVPRRCFAVHLGSRSAARVARDGRLEQCTRENVTNRWASTWPRSAGDAVGVAARCWDTCARHRRNRARPMRYAVRPPDAASKRVTRKMPSAPSSSITTPVRCPSCDY